MIFTSQGGDLFGWESNGNLTQRNRESALCPRLVIEYGTTLFFSTNNATVQGRVVYGCAAMVTIEFIGFAVIGNNMFLTAR